MAALMMGLGLSRKAQHKLVMVLAKTNPKLAANQHVKAGTASGRTRRDGSAAPAPVRRFEQTKKSSLEFVKAVVARAEAAATVLGSRLAKKAAAVLTAAPDAHVERVGEIVIAFKSRLRRATEGRASARARLDALPVSDERPAVASNLTDVFALGFFNSKPKIGAELTARNVPWSMDDPLLEREDNIGLTFRQKLKVRPPPTTTVVGNSYRRYKASGEALSGASEECERQEAPS